MWGLGEAVAAHKVSATSQQLSLGRESGHGTVFCCQCVGVSQHPLLCKHIPVAMVRGALLYLE